MKEGLDFEKTVELIKAERSKGDALKRAYEILTERYRGHHLKTVTKFYHLFQRDTEKICKKDGFLHCTNFNKLMSELLIDSGKFQETEIKKKWTLISYISPHQYLKVNVGEDRWINIDLWAKAYGIPFGDYTHGFHHKGSDLV